MTKIIFVNKTLLMGGIEKCIELFAKDLNKTFEIEVVYLTKQNLDQSIVNKIERYAKTTYIDDYKNEKINCDICIWCSLYFDYKEVKSKFNAKSYFAWIHSMPRADANCLLDNQKFIDEVDEFVCVSNAVKNNLNISKTGVVIHNFLDEDIYNLAGNEDLFKCNQYVLKLVTVSRLSRGKGFERIKEMTDCLDSKNINYKWLVVGNGRSKEAEIKSWFEGNENIVFVGKKDNPYPYIKQADYMVQLSDDESWGIVITEAKSLKVPCIVTNFESSIEQIKNQYNGLIINKENCNYSEIINDMIENKVKYKENLKEFTYINETDLWINIINKYTK